VRSDSALWVEDCVRRYPTRVVRNVNRLRVRRPIFPAQFHMVGRQVVTPGAIPLQWSSVKLLPFE
jgi:hypothetical protein